MKVRDERYEYSITFNGVEASLLRGLMERGIYGRTIGEVVRRIVDARLVETVDVPKFDLVKLAAHDDEDD